MFDQFLWQEIYNLYFRKYVLAQLKEKYWIHEEHNPDGGIHTTISTTLHYSPSFQKMGFFGSYEQITQLSKIGMFFRLTTTDRIIVYHEYRYGISIRLSNGHCCIYINDHKKESNFDKTLLKRYMECPWSLKRLKRWRNLPLLSKAEYV